MTDRSPLCAQQMGVKPTIEMLKKHIDAAKEKFGTTTTVAYATVAQTQFSIAVYYGGVIVHGHYFSYNPADDSLIRHDVGKWLLKQERVKK